MLRRAPSADSGGYAKPASSSRDSLVASSGEHIYESLLEIRAAAAETADVAERSDGRRRRLSRRLRRMSLDVARQLTSFGLPPKVAADDRPTTKISDPVAVFKRRSLVFESEGDSGVSSLSSAGQAELIPDFCAARPHALARPQPHAGPRKMSEEEMRLRRNLYRRSVHVNRPSLAENHFRE